MTKIEKSIEIKASPERAWEMFAFDRMPERMDEYKSLEYAFEVCTPEYKFRVGTSAHVIGKHVEFNFFGDNGDSRKRKDYGSFEWHGRGKSYHDSNIYLETRRGGRK